MPKLTIAELRKRVNPIDNKPDPDLTTRLNPMDNPKTLSLDKVARLLDIKWKYFSEDATKKLAGIIAPTLDYINKVLDIMEQKCACNSVEVEDYTECACNMRNGGCYDHCSQHTKCYRGCPYGVYAWCSYGEWWYGRGNYCLQNYSTYRYKLDDNLDICSAYYVVPPTEENRTFNNINNVVYQETSQTYPRTWNAYRVDLVRHYHREKRAIRETVQHILSDNVIGISWTHPELGIEGWEYINSAGNIISNEEAEQFIANSPLFNPVDEIIDGQYMVKFPVGFVRSWTGEPGCDANGKFCIAVKPDNSDVRYPRHPTFYNYYAGGTIDSFYLGKYKAGGGTKNSLSVTTSLPDVVPYTTIGSAYFCLYCRNRGAAKWHCQTFYEHFYVALLMLIESKGNIIGKHGYGSIEDDIVKTGKSGKFILGIDDFYSNGGEFLEGIRGNGYLMLPHPNHSKFLTRVPTGNSLNTSYLSYRTPDYTYTSGFSRLRLSNRTGQGIFKSQYIPEIGLDFGIFCLGQPGTPLNTAIPDYQYYNNSSWDITYANSVEKYPLGINIGNYYNSLNARVGGRLACYP